MFCPPLKPVLSPVARGVHQACSNVAGDVVPLFQELFTDATNDTGFSNTRATPQYVETDTGNLYPVPAGAIPIKGARPVYNLVASSDTPSTQNITVVVGRIYAVRIGSESASGATAVCSGAFTGTLTGDGADSYALNGSATTTTLTVTITGSIRKLQVQDITHRAASSVAPDEYVDSATDHGTGIDGFRYFTTALANTVDGSGVVTDGTGAALTGIALANVPGATNFDQRSTPKTADYTTKVGLTITDNAAAGPFGNVSAALITGTGSADSYAQKGASLVDYIAGTNYCFWQIVKPGTSSWHRIALPYGAYGTSSDRDAWFHLSESGSVGTTQEKIDSAGIRLLGSGYYLCWITGTAINNNVYRPGYILVANADASTSSTGTVYVAHNQVEVGTLPTVPIVTSGSTASTDAAVLDFSGVTGFTTPNETRIVATGLGPNLVTNGDFASDLSGWAKVGDAATTIEWDAGRALLTSATTFDGLTQTITVEVGKQYMLLASVELGTAANALLKVNAPVTQQASTSTGVMAVSFVASVASTPIQITNFTELGTLWVDNVYLFEIDPTRNVETIIDVNNWDGTDLSDIVPHANIISVTQYAPGERP